MANSFSWSVEQEAIFAWFAKDQATLNRLSADVKIDAKGNLVVVARAGVGKTTTLLEGVKRATETRKWIGAFGNKNAKDLKVKLFGRHFDKKEEKAVDAELQARFGVKIQTFHSLGMGYVMGRYNGVRVAEGSDRADALTNAVVPPTTPDDVKRCVSKLHTKGREIAPHAKTPSHLNSLCVQFECEPDEKWEREGFNAAWVCTYAVKAMAYAATTRPTEIDFADMIFLPVVNGWMRPRFDMVVGDETQDLTVAQLELALGSLAPGGRACMVGDNRQAIYAFRGADTESLARLKAELNAAELGLKTTYRCGKAIVALAAELVPDFVAAPGNPEGTITDLAMSNLVATVGYGDFVLSRANAPLMRTAMAILRGGRRARIAGKDIGKGLTALVNKLCKGAARESVPAFINRLSIWQEKELVRAGQIKTEATREARKDYVRDQFNMLLELTDGAVSVNAICAAIDGLFTDDGLGDAGVVTLSSVHRAKGLEADRVFILGDTLRAGEIEEDNIRYVAITRAKKELVWVFGEPDAR